MEGIDLRQHGYLFLLDNEGDVERFQDCARAPALARRAVARAVGRRGARDRPAARAGRAAGRDVLRARRLRDARGRRPVVRARARRAAGLRGDRDRGRGRQAWSASRRPRVGSRREHRRLLRRRVVARGRRDGRRRASRSRASSAGCASRPEDGGLPERLPLTIDFSTSFYFHREGPGLVFGGREQTLEEVAEPARAAAAGARRAAGAVVVVGLLRGVSPDHNAIVGEAAEPSRFLYATGFSGPRLPAGAGGRRARRRARRRPRADARPVRVRRRAIRARARAAGGVRHLMALGRRRTRRLLGAALGLAVVAVTFAVVLPRIADYHAVWNATRDLSWAGVSALAARRSRTSSRSRRRGRWRSRALVYVRRSWSRRHRPPRRTSRREARRRGSRSRSRCCAAGVSRRGRRARCRADGRLEPAGHSRIPDRGTCAARPHGWEHALLQTVAVIGFTVFVGLVGLFAAGLEQRAARASDRRPCRADSSTAGLRVIRRGPVDWGGESARELPARGARAASPALAPADARDPGRPPHRVRRAARLAALVRRHRQRGQPRRGVRRPGRSRACSGRCP